MKYIKDEQALFQHAASPRGKVLVKYMKTNVQKWIEYFQDDPEIVSGWGHTYFCSKCGTMLCFDIQKPHEHICPLCGNIESGDVYDSAWVYIYRYDALMSAFQASVLYRLNHEKKYLEYFKRVIQFYAENWYRFAEHGRRVWPSGQGKITSQALNEAIFLVRIVNGLELLDGELESGFVRNVTNWFLIPCAYYLDAQKRKIHNIPCWINAAVGAAGLYAGNTDLIDRAFERELGLFDQVRNGGVTKDGFWYEGSIHYHYFTVESSLNLLLFAALHEKEVPSDVKEILLSMLKAPYQLAFSNGRLPNPNDGWPNLNLKSYSYLYYMGAKIFDSDMLRNAAYFIDTQKIPRQSFPLSGPVYAGDDSIEWLLFSDEKRSGVIQPTIPDFQEESISFPYIYFAMLRKNQIEVFQKYGHCTPSHAHPDKMMQEVCAFRSRITHDLSNCGYAAAMCTEFHRTSVSHNTVVINGKSQTSILPGELISFSKDFVDVQIKNAYKGVDFRRKVQLVENGFSDVFLVNCDRRNTIDWFYHLDGELVGEIVSVPTSLEFVQEGYQYLTKIRRIVADGNVQEFLWKFENEVYGKQKLFLNGAELYLSESPDNPPQTNHSRTTIILRYVGENVQFVQEWEFYKKMQEE